MSTEDTKDIILKYGVVQYNLGVFCGELEQLEALYPIIEIPSSKIYTKERIDVLKIEIKKLSERSDNLKKLLGIN